MDPMGTVLLVDIRIFGCYAYPAFLRKHKVTGKLALPGGRGVDTLKTWEPFSNWLITMVIVSSPKDRVVGPLPNGHSWLTTGGY